MVMNGQVHEQPARMGSSPAVSPRCWYCGVRTPWFWCGCKWSGEVREGKRARPVLFWRNGRRVVLLDEEVVAANLGGVERYRPRVFTPVHAEDAVNTSATVVNTEAVHAEGVVVHKTSPDDTEGVHAGVHAGDREGSAADRKAYRAEWQRQNRSRERAAKEAEGSEEEGSDGRE